MSYYGINIVFISIAFQKENEEHSTALPPITSKEMQINFKPGFSTWTELC